MTSPVIELSLVNLTAFSSCTDFISSTGTMSQLRKEKVSLNFQFEKRLKIVREQIKIKCDQLQFWPNRSAVTHALGDLVIIYINEELANNQRLASYPVDLCMDRTQEQQLGERWEA